MYHREIGGTKFSQKRFFLYQNITVAGSSGGGFPWEQKLRIHIRWYWKDTQCYRGVLESHCSICGQRTVSLSQELRGDAIRREAEQTGASRGDSHKGDVVFNSNPAEFEPCLLNIKRESWLYKPICCSFITQLITLWQNLCILAHYAICQRGNVALVKSGQIGVVLLHSVPLFYKPLVGLVITLLTFNEISWKVTIGRMKCSIEWKQSSSNHTL